MVSTMRCSSATVPSPRTCCARVHTSLMCDAAAPAIVDGDEEIDARKSPSRGSRSDAGWRRRCRGERCKGSRRRVHLRFVSRWKAASTTSSCSPNCSQHDAVRVGRLGDVRPHHGAAVLVTATPGRGGPPLRCDRPVDELTYQSLTLTLSAACAAARRATGTRYGEQLT